MAATAALGDWENIISAHINGAPLPVMMDAVRDAAIEFCRDTRIDRRMIRALAVAANAPATPIPDGADSEFPGAVITVWTSEGVVPGCSRRDLETRFPDGWAKETVTDLRDIYGWISLRPGEVSLVGAPVNATTIDLEVAYQPKRNASGIPQFLYEMFAYEIGYGALAILHAHDSAAYANPGMAGQYKQLFATAKHDAANKGADGFQKSHRRTRLDRTFR